jgi:hypothetical protein
MLYSKVKYKVIMENINENNHKIQDLIPQPCQEPERNLGRTLVGQGGFDEASSTSPHGAGREDMFLFVSNQGKVFNETIHCKSVTVIWMLLYLSFPL